MLGWGRRRERLLEEFEQHVESETAENIAAGMSADEARRAARKRFGNTLLAAEARRRCGAGCGWSAWCRTFATLCGSCAGTPASS
jgi:hypothetical protein